MTRTFFLEESAQVRRTSVKSDYKVVTEASASFENALLESEIFYKDILIESTRGEGKAILNEDAKQIKETLVKYFEKMVKFFQDLGKKIANFFKTAWAKIKKFFADAKAWVKGKAAALKAKGAEARQRQIRVSLQGKYNGGKLPEIKAAVNTIIRGGSVLTTAQGKATFVNANILATAIKNLMTGDTAIASMEKVFQEAVANAKKGLVDAKKGLSAAKAGKDSAEIKSSKDTVSAAKKQVQAKSKAGNQATRTAMTIMRDSMKVVRAFSVDKEDAKEQVKSFKQNLKTERKAAK